MVTALWIIYDLVVVMWTTVRRELSRKEWFIIAMLGIVVAAYGFYSETKDSHQQQFLEKQLTDMRNNENREFANENAQFATLRKELNLRANEPRANILAAAIAKIVKGSATATATTHNIAAIAVSRPEAGRMQTPPRRK